MKTVTAIGLDIAKSVFQVHGIDAAGKAVIRKQLKRARVIPFFMKLPPCIVGIEACASSHYWARELTALGHEVKLMPPALKHGTKHRPWLASLLNRRPTKVAAIALANKLARMAWAMMAKGERYKEPIALAR